MLEEVHQVLATCLTEIRRFGTLNLYEGKKRIDTQPFTFAVLSTLPYSSLRQICETVKNQGGYLKIEEGVLLNELLSLGRGTIHQSPQ